MRRQKPLKTLAVYMLLFIATIFGFGIIGTAALGQGDAGFALTLGSLTGLPLCFGVISMFETRTMLAALEKMFLPRTFLLDTFFKGQEISNTEHVDIDVYKGKRRLAPFVSHLHEGKVIDRTGFVTRSFKPPYIKEKTPFSGADLLNRQAGETIYAPGALNPMQRAEQQLGKDLLELDQMITRREEWMASKALFTGKVRCIGDGIDMQVDFLRDPELLITLTDLFWGDSDGVPITNLKIWKELVAKKSGNVPDVLICGADVIMPFLENAQVQKLMDKTKIALGQIILKELPSGVTYYGTIEGLDVYTYNEYYLDDNDVLQPMAPVKQILLGSSRARAARHYGAIRDLKATAAVARFPKSWEQEDPSVRWIMLQSAPLPVPVDTDSYLAATVVQ